MAKKKQSRRTAAALVKVDPEEVFIWGVAFAKVAHRIKMDFVKMLGGSGTSTANTYTGSHLNLITPMAVNSAFSLELFLKCLHLENSGIIPQIHDLQKLFEGITLVQQLQIEKHYHALLKQAGRAKGKTSGPPGGPQIDPFDLRASLAEQKDAFEDFRYLFEKKKRFTITWVDTIAEAAKRTIIDSHPHWSKHADPYT